MKETSDLEENILDYPTPSQIVIIGTNGTGKTTFVEHLLSEELKKGNNHILIVVLDYKDFDHVEYTEKQSIGNFSGVKKIIYFPGLLKTITSDFKNGLVIFSDCRAYLHHWNDDLHCFIIRRRQNFVNSVFVFHDFAEALPKALVFATHYVIFKTIRRRKNLKKCILNQNQIIKAMDRVNARSATQPHYFDILPAE
jgi:GTPase SAR1 family protein